MRFFINEEDTLTLASQRELHLTVGGFRKYLERFEEDTIVDIENDRGSINGQIANYSYTEEDEKLCNRAQESFSVSYDTLLSMFMVTLAELQGRRDDPKMTSTLQSWLTGRLELLRDILGESIPEEYWEQMEEFI